MLAPLEHFFIKNRRPNVGKVVFKLLILCFQLTTADGLNILKISSHIWHNSFCCSKQNKKTKTKQSNFQQCSDEIILQNLKQFATVPFLSEREGKKGRENSFKLLFRFCLSHSRDLKSANSCIKRKSRHDLLF